jgi:glutaminase
MHDRRSPIHDFLQFLHAKYADFREGEVATYIPELSTVDPERFGICIATADGFVYEVGDSRQGFTIQSISKPFVYGLALDERGPKYMQTKVGVEPSGDAFNAISLHKTSGCPLNPMINAGAIATTGQIGGAPPQMRFESILEMFSRYTGRVMGIDPAVYESESRTGHRNRAIGHLLRNFDVLDGDPTATVDTYFRQCAISVNCVDLALMGATLANQGINPRTGIRAIAEGHVQSVLSVMASCGMYDFSGGWIYDVGMPAKSGVAGGVLAVLAGQLGIGVFSPRLDAQGNSARALQVCRELSQAWQLHQFNPPFCTHTSRRMRCSGAERQSSRIRQPMERECLGKYGGHIHLFEIQGNLAFATAEPIIRDVVGCAGHRRAVILDFHHVTGINSVAARLFTELADNLGHHGTAVFFTSAQQLPLLRQVAAAHLAEASSVDGLFRFRSTDAALEWCEDELLRELMPTAPLTVEDLRVFEIASGLAAEELAVFRELIVRRSFAPGEHVIRRGDAATTLFLVTKGVVGVWLGEHENGSRVASFSVGTMVGEMAFLDGVRRSANVVAEGDVECAVFALEDFNTLLETHPRLHTKILRNIGVSLATKLRRVNEDVRILVAERER